MTHHSPLPSNTHKVTVKPKGRIDLDGVSHGGSSGWGKGFLHLNEARIHPLKTNAPAAFPARVTFPVSSHLSVTRLGSQARNQSSTAPPWPSGSKCDLWPSPVISTQSLSIHPFLPQGKVFLRINKYKVMLFFEYHAQHHYPSPTLHYLPAHFCSAPQGHRPFQGGLLWGW